MKLIQFLRKPYFASFLAVLIFFMSCERYESVDNSIEDTYSTGYIEDSNLIDSIANKLIEYDNYINNFNGSKAPLPRNLSPFEDTLDAIDDGRDENPPSQKSPFNEVKDYLNSNKVNFKVLNEGIDIAEYMNLENPKKFMQNTGKYSSNEISLTEQFGNDFAVLGNLTPALTKFIQSIDSALLTNNEKKKMHVMINMLKAIEKSGYVSPAGQKVAGKSSCGRSLLGLAFAFTGLAIASSATAATAGATSPAVYFAGANFIRASISVGYACRSGAVHGVTQNLNQFRQSQVSYPYAAFKNIDKVIITNPYVNLLSSNDLRKTTLYRGRYNTNSVAPIFAFKEPYSNEILYLDIFHKTKESNALHLVEYVQIGQTSRDNICTTLFECIGDPFE